MQVARVRKGLGMLPAIGGGLDVDDDEDEDVDGGAAWVEVVERGASVAIDRVRHAGCCCWEALKPVKRCLAGMAVRLDAMLGCEMVVDLRPANLEMSWIDFGGLHFLAAKTG